MTNDYKETLLKYMTGKLENETGVNEPQFGNMKESSNNIRNQIAQLVGSEYTYISIRHQLYNEKYQSFLIWGVDRHGDEDQPFVAIADKNANLLKYITTFDSGSSLFNIIYMKQDEDGYIYAMSRDYDSSTEVQTNRVLLLNNIFASGVADGNYYIKLRRSYIIPSTYGFKIGAFNLSCDGIVKVPDESTYYLTGYGNSTGQGLQPGIVLKFQINVGSENTWEQYTIPTPIGFTNFSVILEKTSTGVIYRVYGLDISDAPPYKFVEYEINENGAVSLVNEIPAFAYGSTFTNQVLAISKTKVYIACALYDTNPKGLIYLYNGTTIQPIYSNSGYSYVEEGQTVYEYPLYWMINLNNVIFFNEIQPIEGANYNQNIGIIIDDNVYVENSGKISQSLSNNIFTPISSLFVTNQYNLYNINALSDINSTEQAGYITKRYKMIYNQNNYNGLPYKALNSLIPNSGILYDNNDVIFARNLYNKTVSGATTTSTVQIPNTLLNDTTIAQSDLIGQTNMELVNDTTPITKNIYETVDINFSNTLVMRNDNDENNKILNPIGSSRLNNSISQTIDYDNAQATKLRVNYADDSNLIITLSSAQITILTDTKARYSFSIYVDKEIDNIQIISFDENTVYQTINNLNLTIGKVYSIIQDVEIL